MTTSELKKYIYENNQLYFLLESIGCHHIKMHDDYCTAANINGDNNSAIVIYLNPYLHVKNYTRENEFGSDADIFTLIQYNFKVSGKSFSFYEIVKYVHTLFHLDIDRLYNVKSKHKNSILDIINEAYEIGMGNSYDQQDIRYEDNIDMIPLVHIDFFREGIINKTIKKFKLGYSFSKKRTIIPMHYWLNGKILGYNMRSSIKNCEEFGIRKYMISKGYQKSINIYGLWENKECIEQLHRVVVYEAEKSVLKRDSLGDSTGVALSGHSISNEQISILMSLNVNEIIIAMDKDVPLYDVLNMCEKFFKYRTVSFIYDKRNLLREKDSPADANMFNYQTLFEERIVYDKKWHLLHKKILKGVIPLERLKKN